MRSVIYNKDSRNMDEIEDESVSLVVTSPPYNCGKKYDTYTDSVDWKIYELMLHDVFGLCYEKLRQGGKICVNVANLGRKPYIQLNCLVGNILTDLGFHLKGEVIWIKPGNNCSTAWGSFQSCENPCLVDWHEYIVVGAKGWDDAAKKTISLSPRIEGSISDITKDEFMKFTHSTWRFATSRSDYHPVVFPEELPYRCIKLFSYPKDIVLDPFAGIGTTPITAKQNNRIGIGYEISPQYCRIANFNLNDAKYQKKLDKFETNVKEAGS